MKTWFDDDSRPVAVDDTHPVDLLELEPEPPARSAPDALTMIERIGGSFIRGNPFIIQVSWRILLNKESKSMRACARKLGCTPQAISKRVRLLAEHFGYPTFGNWRGITPAHWHRPLVNPGWLTSGPPGGTSTQRLMRYRKSSLRYCTREAKAFEVIETDSAGKCI
jgi:hypothetical protein